MPSLLVMVDRFPGLFCPGQVWYRDEAFASAPFEFPAPPPPTRVVETPYALPPELVGVYGSKLPTAAALVAAYLEAPEHSAWRGYLWTSDFDGDQQRVFVGGTANGRGFEVHRFLHITKRWGIGIWQ